MVAALEILNGGDAQSKLSKVVNCLDDPIILRNTVVAEYVRATVYQPLFAATMWKKPTSVHSQRISSHVRSNLGFLWKDIKETEFGSELSVQTSKPITVMEIVKNLARIGDLIDLGQGFWAPGPTRLVSSSNTAEGALLAIGGMPFELMEEQVGHRLRCFGCSRVLPNGRVSLQKFGRENRLESVDEWLGGREGKLASWTQKTFTTLIKTMTNDAGTDASECEVYAPDHLPGKQGAGNWQRVQDFNELPSDLRIFRSPGGSSTVFDRPYFLAEVRTQNGRAFFQRSAPIPYDIRLRFMFGFEATKNVSRSVSLEVGKHSIIARIPFKLPEPEDKILAFGLPIDTDTKGRVRSIQFSRDTLPFLVQTLERLGIRISQVARGGTFS